MKRANLKKAVSGVVFIFLVVFGVLSVAGCDSLLGGDGTNNNNNNNSGIDYTNYTTGYSIRVSNTTQQNLVAFKWSLSTGTLVGGVRGGATNHGFKKSALFSATGDFPLILITEEEYNANKSNLNALANSPFTRVYAFYNANGENDNVYEISGKLGGQYSLVLQNGSGMNVELRLNGVHGAPLGYAQEGMYNTTLKIEQGDYLVFPVFRKFNANRGEIISVYPKYTNGKPQYDQFTVNADEPEYELDLSGYIQGVTLSTGSAYILIQNNSGTGVQLRKGGALQKTSTGISTINNAGNRLFQVDMANLGGGSDNLADTADV
ncbi:MAG: hypothetical protein LBQ30_06950, partial [Treponema sp.]|nr:hypothetical protein [Treponema sp.]